LRARSGAQINEQEYKRLRRLVPTITDPEKAFFAKLERMTIELQQLQGITTNMPASKGLINNRAPIIQRNKSTGAVRHSVDGGETWIPGAPK
jgi:hypothetical protein